MPLLTVLCSQWIQVSKKPLLHNGISSDQVCRRKGPLFVLHAQSMPPPAEQTLADVDTVQFQKALQDCRLRTIATRIPAWEEPNPRKTPPICAGAGIRTDREGCILIGRRTRPFQVVSTEVKGSVIRSRKFPDHSHRAE